MYKVEYQNEQGQWITEYWNLRFIEALEYAQIMRREGITSARVVYQKTGWTLTTMQSQ